MRVFLGLTEVSGFFHRLEGGFAEIGVEAEHVPLQCHRFSYAGVKRQCSVVRWAQAAVTRRIRAHEGRCALRNALCALEVFASRLLLLVWAIARFDIFILGAGSSFFSFREFPLLRLLGKKIIYTLHGTDARPPYIDGFLDPSHYGFISEAPADETIEQRAERLAPFHVLIAEKRAAQVRIIEKYASAIFCAPGYSQFLTRDFVDFYAVGLPTTIAEGFAPYEASKCAAGEVRILHAPSYSAAKGTAEVRRTIGELKQRGLPIEYVEISNKTNLEVFREIACCDIVVDQVYSDTPLAALAAEAGLLGRPAVVGGYFSAMAASTITPGHMPPSAFCLSEAVTDTVALLVSNAEERKRIGDETNQFVSRRWHPAAVAARCLRVIDAVPDEWLIKPSSVTYLHGAGLGEAQARANVAAIISRFGVAALQLSHKPDLERRFSAFASGGNGC